MKNALQYYYNLQVTGFKQKKDEYSFYKDGISYLFMPVERSYEEINEIYMLAKQLNELGVPCHNIMLNVEDKIITSFNNKNYVLLRKYVDSNDLITIRDIISFSKYTSFMWNYSKISRSEWKKLWSEKLDYLEYQLSQIGRRYPLLCEMFSYYEGLSELGIQLYNILDSIIGDLCVCHKRLGINTTINDFYNPLNFIIDHRVRDVAEYFKQKIVFTDQNIDGEILYYLDNISINNNDSFLFFVRMTFPSFYFDTYENILNNEKSSKELNDIIINHAKYEKILKKIYDYLSSYINIPYIEWLYNY